MGIPPAPRGLPQIDVSFEIDANGIVNVSAKDKMTGLEQAMQVTPSSGLAPDEIDRLIMEAENSAETDRQTKEIIMQRNRLDSLVRNTRAALNEFGRSIPHEEQNEINEVLKLAEEALKSDEMDVYNNAIVMVEDRANRITEALMAAV